MLTPDEEYDLAQPMPPFSNSDGYDWLENHCGTCVNDRELRTTGVGGCVLALVALQHRTPRQWIRDSGEWQCVEYRHEDDGPFEPAPIPDPPGQLVLVPRETYTAVRMLTSVPEPVMVGGAQ